MVYNTTDNRSSLSITDLTSDCEYSVTVAGRDGAGRLGQESEELNGMVKIIVIHISFKIFYSFIGTKHFCYHFGQPYSDYG